LVLTGFEGFLQVSWKSGFSNVPDRPLVHLSARSDFQNINIGCNTWNLTPISTTCWWRCWKGNTPPPPKLLGMLDTWIKVLEGKEKRMRVIKKKKRCILWWSDGYLYGLS
jgi:hypothetical protein